MSDPNILEMETSSETANYRKDRLKTWEKLKAAHLDYIEDAEKAGATPEAARAAAGKSMRGEVRVFLSELLVRAPTEAIVAFIRAGHDWTGATESLLLAGNAVPDLVAHAYPRATWAQRVSAIEKKLAEDEASWTAWVGGWTEEIGAVVPNIGTMMKDVAGGLAAVGHGLGDAIRYLPLALGGVAAVGLGLWVALRTRS